MCVRERETNRQTDRQRVRCFEPSQVTWLFATSAYPSCINMSLLCPCMQAVGQQHVRSLASSHHHHHYWLGVCVSVGKGPAPLAPVPHYGIQIILLQPHSHPHQPSTGNRALSKQASGVRGKAISAIGLVLMDCRVCWQVVQWCLQIDQIHWAL